ncbi:MAG: hypothetical protein CL947_04500 [Epsilonproteobacteria bacterium]|nr:hypothetical protein [Campylobacterota bacterium]|tara:strand:- start:3604 stop:4401 length:798 start_codon:yes stop_codon:yes gene_type:complete
MKNKILLLLSLAIPSTMSPSFFSSKSKVENNTLYHQLKNISFMQGLKIGTSALGLSLFASYLCCRESNAIKIDRVNNLWSKFNMMLEQNGSKKDELQKVYDISTELQKFEDEIQTAYSALYHRWTFLKPWNWTNEMRDAYYKSCLLHCLSHYHTIMLLEQANQLDEHHLLLLARHLYGLNSSLPLVVYFDMLKRDVSNISQSLKAFSTPWAKAVESTMLKALRILSVSEQCLQERQQSNRLAAQNSQNFTLSMMHTQMIADSIRR